MTWFHDIFGFDEGTPEETQAKLRFDGGTLTSLINGRSYRTGTLEMPTLQDLRDAVARGDAALGKTGLQVSTLYGDARELHRDPRFKGALFQVASQFNLLEMTDPSVSPEQGVSRYEYDMTQGPACAIAAGAATVYRNYFIPMDGGIGQTRERQIDTLADLGALLSARLSMPVEALWTMTNGYALLKGDGLAAINAFLSSTAEATLQELRGTLRIGLHWDAEVTDSGYPGQLVSQAFCSALPIAYSDIGVPVTGWAPFAALILDAIYEATLLAAALNRRRGGSNIVLLTRVGGGAFGNMGAWIDQAIYRACDALRDRDNLDIRNVQRAS